MKLSEFDSRVPFARSLTISDYSNYASHPAQRILTPVAPSPPVLNTVACPPHKASSQSVMAVLGQDPKARVKTLHKLKSIKSLRERLLDTADIIQRSVSWRGNTTAGKAAPAAVVAAAESAEKPIISHSTYQSFPDPDRFYAMMDEEC